MQDNVGIASEESYKYTAKDGDCQAELDDKSAQISGFKLIPSSREEVLKYVIAKIGPVNAVIDPSGGFIQYKEGVYYNPNCNTNSSFLHAVLIVGYGSDGPGKDFYWVKNSWGNSIYIIFMRTFSFYSTLNNFRN